MRIIKHGQLFGGIFGFGLAAQWAGIKNVWYNDNDQFCCEIVRARMRDGQIKDKVKIYECDIKNIGKQNLESVDVLSAGPPCQPSSVAGKRKGKSDDRWLWEEAIRICGEIKPSFIIFENPPGILTLENGNPFKEILLALESQGYKVEIFNLPAASQGAWHRRERIWILADSGCRDTWQPGNTKKVALERYGTKNSSDKACGSSSNGRKRVITNANSTQWGSNKRESDTETNGGDDIRRICQDVPYSKGSKYKSSGNTWSGGDGLTNSCEDVSNTNNTKTTRYRKNGREICSKSESKRFNSSSKEWRATKSCMGRMDSRLPPELDGYWDREPENVPRAATGVKNRTNRLKGLGNAVVPQIPYIFFQIIERIIKQTQ